jgi:hypothetical protein
VEDDCVGSVQAAGVQRGVVGVAGVLPQLAVPAREGRGQRFRGEEVVAVREGGQASLQGVHRWRIDPVLWCRTRAEVMTAYPSPRCAPTIALALHHSSTRPSSGTQPGASCKRLRSFWRWLLLAKTSVGPRWAWLSAMARRLPVIMVARTTMRRFMRAGEGSAIAAW